MEEHQHPPADVYENIFLQLDQSGGIERKEIAFHSDWTLLLSVSNFHPNERFQLLFLIYEKLIL